VERRPLKRAHSFDLDDAIYGIHAVEEALAAGERLRRLHVARDRQRDPAIAKLIRRAEALEIPVRLETHGWFAQFRVRAHQGVVAVAPPFRYASLPEILAAREADRPALVVVLDHITDPHNLGAIVRTAECAGVDAVVIPERRAAGVNATVRKVAAGATEHVPIARVGNIAEALRQLKKAGLWIAGADAGPDTVEMARADLQRDLALVVGSEGGGLSNPVRLACDYLVRIPLRGRLGSLNASVAVGVLLFEALRQRASSS
jgi:23S rRNA (guanosine2251-2'-O)-methyltransferase